MTTNRKIAVVALLVGVVLLFVWLTNSGKYPQAKGGKSLVPAKISTNWDDEFELLSKDANGLYFFNYFLKSRLDKGKHVSKIDHNYSLDTIPRNTSPTFLFIGKKFVLNALEIDSLLERVALGSKVFIAQHELNPEFYNRLFDNIELSYHYSPSIQINSKSNNNYTFFSIFQNDTIATKWRGYKNILTNSYANHSVLSTHGKLENSIAIQVGKGYIYLCSTPELFVNYQLKHADGINYAKHWLNRIPSNENVYWLELGRFTKAPINDYEEEIEEKGTPDDSYLQYIFQQKALVYAMILLLFGVLLYVLFRAKRTQPIVPYLSKKKNMTLVFADTITSIYFADRNPSVMLDIQKRNFFNAVQKHFFVDLSKRKEGKEVRVLAQKSSLSETEINELLLGFEVTELQGIDENYLIQHSKKLLAFYRQTGIITDKIQQRIEARTFHLFRALWLTSILLLSGLFTIFLGFYYLVNAVGIGIVFWPLGALLLTMAVLRMSKPLLLVSKTEITYHPLIGKQKKYELNDISTIETSEKGVKFRFNDGKMLIVNYWELNHQDAQQFKRFIALQNKLKL